MPIGDRGNDEASCSSRAVCPLTSPHNLTNGRGQPALPLLLPPVLHHSSTGWCKNGNAAIRPVALFRPSTAQPATFECLPCWALARGATGCFLPPLLAFHWGLPRGGLSRRGQRELGKGRDRKGTQGQLPGMASKLAAPNWATAGTPFCSPSAVGPPRPRICISRSAATRKGYFLLAALGNLFCG